MICLGKLIASNCEGSISKTYFNFENIYIIIHSSNIEPNRSTLLCMYTCLWNCGILFSEYGIQMFSPLKFSFPYAFHELYAHITASKIPMNRKFNSFAANWYDSWRICICKKITYWTLDRLSNIFSFEMLIVEILRNYAIIIIKSTQTSDTVHLVHFK